MPQRREKKSPPAKDRRPIKKKTSILNSESIAWIDYKDVNLLRRFMSERAKIRARRVTGNDQQQQATVAKAIKLAREMALLPYSVRQVTQRSKGRRRPGRPRRPRRVAAAVERSVDAVRVDTERRLRRHRRSARHTRNRLRRPRVARRRSDERRRRSVRVRHRHRGRRLMKIVLRADVEHVGQKGDIVDVADGYARNFLVPRGLALRATSGIQKQADAMRRSRDARDRHAREAAQAIADQLAPTVRIEARAGEGGRLFGSVTSSDVAAAVKAQLGVEVDRRDIALDEPLKDLGIAELVVRLHRDVSATLRVEVVSS